MIVLPDKPTENEKAIIQYFQAKFLRLEHRIAYANKIAARSYIQPQEHAVFEELVDK